jgi:hypothetical protein
MKKLLTVLSILIYIYGCSVNQERKRSKEIEKIVTEWYGRKIVMPDSVFILINKKLSIPKEDPFHSINKKILTFISGDCEKCIYNLREWSILLDSIKTNNNIKLIVIILTSDIEQFVEKFNQDIPKEIIPYFDVYFKFLTTYNLPDDWALRTFLLDNNNRVLLIGNPIYNSKLKKLYLQKII